MKNGKIEELSKRTIQLLEIIMNIEGIKLVTKQRFIIYYGLDKNKEKIHSYSEIAKLEGCSTSNIGRSINQIKGKLLRISNEEIEILRIIVNNS